MCQRNCYAVINCIRLARISICISLVSTVHVFASVLIICINFTRLDLQVSSIEVLEVYIFISTLLGQFWDMICFCDALNLEKR